jgi:hypothetical protein
MGADSFPPSLLVTIEILTRMWDKAVCAAARSMLRGIIGEWRVEVKAHACLAEILQALARAGLFGKKRVVPFAGDVLGVFLS